MKNHEDKYLEAKQKVGRIKCFYIHLITFLIFNAIFATFNYYENSWSYAWFLWITFGWGIAVISDYLKAFERNPLFNKKWEERKINEYMAKEVKRQNWE